jgi:hypothetical protein
MTVFTLAPAGGVFSQADPLFRLLQSAWINFFGYPVDNLSPSWRRTYAELRTWFYDAKWFDVYDFIEFLVQDLPSGNVLLAQTFNGSLESELSGFRFVGTYLVPITAEVEVDAIEAALASGKDNSPHVVHLSRALALISDRKNPDYRNSIKESISAVEAACQLVTKNPKAALGDALKALENRKALHPALKSAFSALYGWTSDADGIRHALTADPGAVQADALFMLVTCSAFVNYLLGSASPGPTSGG